MSLPSGFGLGPYEVVAPLGSGAMGEVYVAMDTRLVVGDSDGHVRKIGTAPGHLICPGLRSVVRALGEHMDAEARVAQQAEQFEPRRSRCQPAPEARRRHHRAAARLGQPSQLR